MSIPTGLVSFSVMVSQSLQPLPHEDALGVKAGLSCLPLLPTELGSLCLPPSQCKQLSQYSIPASTRHSNHITMATVSL